MPLIPEINTQLLIEEPAPGASFLNRLLNQEPARIINFFKLLLKSPLNPLALVPWAAFPGKTDVVMATLLCTGDLETLEALVKAGVKLPSPAENQQIASFRTNLALKGDATLYPKIIEIYKNATPSPEDKKSAPAINDLMLFNNPWIPSITDFHPDSQTAFWHSKALEAIQDQAKNCGYIISDMKSRAADSTIYGTSQGVPEKIEELIQFYASGEQEGVPSLFDNDAFAFTGAIPAKKPLAEVKEIKSEATDAKGIAEDIPLDQVKETKETKETKREVSDTKGAIAKPTKQTVNKRSGQYAFFKQHQQEGEAEYLRNPPEREPKQTAVSEAKPVSATNKTASSSSSSAFNFSSDPTTMSSSQTTRPDSINSSTSEPEVLAEAETVSLTTS